MATEAITAEDEHCRRSARARTPSPVQFLNQDAPGKLALKAAHGYLEAQFESPAAAALQYGVDRQLVNYYVRKLVAAGVPRSEASAVSMTEKSTEEEHPPDEDPAEVYGSAWAYAAQQMQHHGKRVAARLTREKFGISFSSTSAQRAAQCEGQPPGKRGKQLSIPEEVERKLEDMCLVLRELNLPVYRFMILNYVNRLIANTAVADALKDKEVKRGWYYRWLSRCTRLRTANLTPLEMTRAQWATSKNAKMHYDQVNDLLITLKLAVPDPAYDPDRPYSQRLVLLKPERLFSMDESRLTNDTTEKHKGKANRSIVGKGDSREVLANKGGGDGTGIGGSSADGRDLPGFFIFAKNIIHSEDVAKDCRPICRRADPADPASVLPCRFWCNEKGGVTGDLGIRFVRSCIEPCFCPTSPPIAPQC